MGSVTLAVRKNPILMLLYGCFGADLFVDYALFATLILYLQDGGGFEAAALAIAFALPGVFLPPILGSLVDLRGPRWPLLISGLLLALAAALIVPFAGSLWVLGIVILRASARIVFRISLPSIISATAHEDHYAATHSAINACMNIGRVLGPLLAALILNQLGTGALMGLCIGLSIAVALCSASIAFRGADWSFWSNAHEHDNEQAQPQQQNFRNALEQIWTDPILRVGSIAFILATFAFYLSDDFLTLLIKHYDGDADVVAVAISLLGAGGVIGSIGAAKLIARFGELRTYALSIVSNFLCFLVYGFVGSFSLPPTSIQAVLLTFILIMGAGFGVGAVGYGQLIQRRANRRSYSKVSSISNSTASALALLMPLAGAAVIEAHSIELPFQVTAAFFGLTALWVGTQLRQIPTEPPFRR